MTQPRLLRSWVVFAINTVPFYLWGALTDGEFDITGARLPVSALMFVCPALAALAAGGGRESARRRMCTLPRALWLIVALFVSAALVLVASIVVAGTGPSGISVSLVAAVCEELGWTADAPGGERDLLACRVRGGRRGRGCGLPSSASDDKPRNVTVTY
ncbi:MULTISPECIES: hypothetical protein [Rhodococcus]|uniref:hypothetical protein n=1 Tax=Rhodococcus TaxID=1827 RepID=UPI001E44F782|nr:hypothetical protein [Rhodococcus pyridinivorans]MCD2118695.1 hypothetical protein [Rhodococcus pyridinivorans]MCZ4627566.1 hypothetical protein [Rhodococcus pyridinivorans]MCZ4648668.1 hypothetical protein [Rhodococcus pyridinivorans]MDJ0481219.1 hypothetical protein [Rhodococcus pyridinivorans]MDV7254858.1 hypothetical protein [Rhodococcus pyridinivorans]